jgi:hypothetical protein
MWIGRKPRLGACRKLKEFGTVESWHPAKVKDGDEKAKHPLGQWVWSKDWHLELDWGAERLGKKPKRIISF